MKRALLLFCITLLPLSALADQPAPQPAAPAQPAASAPAPAPQEPKGGQPVPPKAGQPQLSLLPSLQPPAKPAAASFKVGLVDINRISSESNMGKKAQAVLKEQQSKLQKQIEGKKKQLEKLKADIERQMPSLAPPQREAKAREFQKKVEEFQKFGMNAEKGLMAQQEKLTRELLVAIEQAAAAIGTESALSAVVVRRELLYLASGVEVQDISEAVVKALNEKSAKEPPRK